MRKLVMTTSLLTIFVRYSLIAHAFTFSTQEPSPGDQHQHLVAEIDSEANTPVPSELDTHFRDLSARCSEDILIFSDGKTLCGELVDMPSITGEGGNAINISEVSAIIFDSEKEPNVVRHVLRNGHAITKELPKESFRFSVEYLENGGEQRVQVFYVSPKDIRYIIISPRQPKSQPGIRPSNVDKAFKDSVKVSSYVDRVVEATELAAAWYDYNSHSILSEATSALVLSSSNVASMHEFFSNIVSYYAQLGAVDEDSVDFHRIGVDDHKAESFSDQNTYGLLLGPKALFSTSESFDAFSHLTVEDVHLGNETENSSLASAEAVVFSTEFTLDNLQAQKLFAAEFNLHFNEDEEAEESDDLGLSGIKYMVDNTEAPLQVPLCGTQEPAANHIAFLTTSCQWLEHKHQCTGGCEASEWPPIKKDDNRVTSSLEYASLSDDTDKIKQNERLAMESLLLEALQKETADFPSEVAHINPVKTMLQLNHGTYMASYPVSNEEYQRFIQATNHPQPTHWIHGNGARVEPQAPVVNVTYKDALAYAEWAGQRLPSYEELAKTSDSLDSSPKDFKEWTSTSSMVDTECLRLYRQAHDGLLLQPGKYASSNIGFRCVKEDK